MTHNITAGIFLIHSEHQLFNDCHEMFQQKSRVTKAWTAESNVTSLMLVF